ncbi:glycoside hydrolase family 72 protein [Babjeviella inositovora NRRL Y-12698]|uniref:1,3-beta-glucanosyltransferase n=1 Tax=Babjeviella inositovora NRRL Y-12698 TaxID=984486 RepID=A0A1E3QN03_9ASCO|nr:glycoside hydrolase family 72 protein [Babjeviella inositovora NRRL Y-12698]ODQ78472.1 glycoside hydrolase family 72 protein [Babjeviella inositovora NRRL Y-12698]
MKLLSLSAAFCLIQAISCLEPVTLKGKRFIQDGNVFWLKGIDYQPGGASGYDANANADVLSDAEACTRDTYVLQQLGVNTVRVYTVNPNVNHDECMTIFNNAGIYLILDVNAGLANQSLNRANPGSSYNAGYLSRVFLVIEAFKNYPNVIGFFSGNEIINDETSAGIDPPYIRAVQRDMKQYIAKNCARAIPVGYSAASDINLRGPTFEYLQCNIDGNDDDSKSDFVGLNSYEWAAGSDWASSGYAKINSTFEDTTVPLFFSEYGTLNDNGAEPRAFDEVTGLYGGLNQSFSGGLVYEYSMEANSYGLVTIGSDGSVLFEQDFENLKAKYGNLTLADISESSVDDTNTITCNSTFIESLDSSFGANFTLPLQPSDILSMINNGFNSSNVGELISNYAPLSSNYTIKDLNGNVISDATVAYVTTYVYQASAATSAASSSTSSTKSSSSKAGGFQAGVNGGLLSLASFVYLLL